jgi:hypothetical protein
MGVRGARSLMDQDPTRYCETFRWNGDNNEQGNLALLVDGKSLLYDVAVRPDNMLHASPATIHDCVGAYIQNLLMVVVGSNSKGSVHIFLDGLCPKEKIPAQIERLGKQAIYGDKLANGDMSQPKVTKVLHHLAEWAYVEAIERLMERTEFASMLHLHRPSMGEGEAHINQWIVQNSSLYENIAIISEDSDFLVYESCPGFIPPSSIKFEDQNGKSCIMGQHYLRSKFIKSFLIQETNDMTVMTAIAALAGCDYILESADEGALKDLRKSIVTSDIGGLRQKLRNNPSASATLTAILRMVAHYKKMCSPETWLETLVKDMAGASAQIARKAIRQIHEIYLYSLELSASPMLEINPGMVDVRRLIQYGIVYCYPLIESWDQAEAVIRPTKLKKDRRGVLPHYDIVDVCSHALVNSPPLTTQMETWIRKSSAWCMPHFKQIRARLYSLIRLAVVNRRMPSNLQPGDFWAQQHASVEEVARIASGQRGMERVEVTIPDHLLMSSGFHHEELMQDDPLAIDRALVYCILGTPQQLAICREKEPQQQGPLFLASIMLPFNLASLLILMATAPNLDPFELTPLTSAEACSEVNQVLPILSVACAHAFLLVDTISCLWAEQVHLPSLAKQAPNVSDTFRHDNALLLWQCLRLGRNLEYLANSDTFVAEDSANIRGYLADCFAQLLELRPDDPHWAELLTKWQTVVLPLWETWWDVFNLDEVQHQLVLAVKRSEDQGTFPPRKKGKKQKQQPQP